jgi:hypothetical protein
MPSEGLVPVRKNKKWGFADFSGKLRIPCKYDRVEPFWNGLSVVTLRQSQGLIDNQGALILEPTYDAIVITDFGIQLRDNGKWGLMSKSGLMLLPGNYDRIEFLNETVARASDANGYTYVNLALGKIIRSPVQ